MVRIPSERMKVAPKSPESKPIEGAKVRREPEDAFESQPVSGGRFPEQPQDPPLQISDLKSKPRLVSFLERKRDSGEISAETFDLMMSRVEGHGFSTWEDLEGHLSMLAQQLNKLWAAETKALSLSPKKIVVVKEAAEAGTPELQRFRVRAWSDGRDGKMDDRTLQDMNNEFIAKFKDDPNPEMQEKVTRARRTNDSLNTMYGLNSGYNAGQLILIKGSALMKTSNDKGLPHPVLLHEVGHALFDLASEVSPGFAEKLNQNGSNHVLRHAHQNPHYLKNNSEFLAASFAKFRGSGEAEPSTLPLISELQRHLGTYSEQTSRSAREN